MDSIRTERTPRRCFRCGSEDHLIAKCPNPPKDNEKRRRQVFLNKKGNCAWDNGEFPSGNFGDSSQLTNWIWYSGATCHITPEVSVFNLGSLEDTNKHIEVADRHHITEIKKDKYELKCATLTEILLSQRYTTYLKIYGGVTTARSFMLIL